MRPRFPERKPTRTCETSAGPPLEHNREKRMSAFRDVMLKYAPNRAAAGTIGGKSGREKPSRGPDRGLGRRSDRDDNNRGRAGRAAPRCAKGKAGLVFGPG